MYTVGIHKINSLFVNDEERKMILVKIDEDITEINKTKRDLTDTISAMINIIMKKQDGYLERINDDLKRLNILKESLINQDNIYKDSYNQYISGGLENRKHVIIDKNALLDDLCKIFDGSIFIENKLDTKIYQDDTYLFALNKNQFIKVDLDSFQETISPVNYPFTYCNSCKLPDEKFFILATPSQQSCFIFDKISDQIIKIQDCPIESDWNNALSYSNDSVYLISGKPKIHHKYSLTKETWNKFSECPFTSPYTYGDTIHGKICITSLDSEKVFYYNTHNDEYTNVLKLNGEGAKHIGYGYILASEGCYIVNKSDSNIWTYHNYSLISGQCCSCMANSRIFKRGKYLYLTQCSYKNIFQFDTENYSYKLMS